MNITTLEKISNVEGHRVNYSKPLSRLYFDKSYGGPSFDAQSWMKQLNQALIRSHCTTPARVSMWFAQVGAECGSFRYTEELASGSEYNWRSDLGNNYAGDGERYKGRTYIQITGRHNYGALSAWAYAHKYVSTKTFFVDHPEKLAQVNYIFLGPVWYWTVARNMNYYADRLDIVGATRAVNGGLNNLGGRTERFHLALKQGKLLLPSGTAVVPAKHTAPVVVAKPKPKPSPKPKPKPVTTVTVHTNDTLSSIAAAHHTTWQTLQRINNLRNPNVIYVGQTLRVA